MVLAYQSAAVADQGVTVVELGRDFMIKNPPGTHSVTWNGPLFLDVGTPLGRFERFPVASVTFNWSRLLDSQGRPLPIAVRTDGRRIFVAWLPYEGPPAPRGSVTDGDVSRTLQNISNLRFQSMMNTAGNMH